jgi:hypothetical protein
LTVDQPRRWGHVYYPATCRSARLAGWVAGHDYRADLQAEFDKDPLLVVRVCSADKTYTPEPDPRVEPFHKIQDAVCRAFPDARIESAFRAYRSAEGRTWLTGVLNSSLDESAAMTSDLRLQKADTDSATSDERRYQPRREYRSRRRWRRATFARWPQFQYALEANMKSPGADPWSWLARRCLRAT